VPSPKVAIIVIAHSVRGELERCFGSIRDHAGMPVQVVLVDNASTDDTLEWVAREHPEVEVVERGHNIGEAARNDGLPLVRAPFTMFLDSDAALTPGALPAMVEALEENPAWGLVGPKLVYDDGTLQQSCRRFPPRLLPLLRRPPLDRWFEDGQAVRRHLMLDDRLDSTRPVLYLIGACHLFRSSLGRAAAPFDPKVFFGWSDADWCLRIRDAGGEVVYLPEVEVIHSYRRASRKRPVSRVAWRQLRAHFRFQLRYLRRRSELAALSEEFDRQAAATS